MHALSNEPARDYLSAATVFRATGSHFTSAYLHDNLPTDLATEVFHQLVNLVSAEFPANTSCDVEFTLTRDPPAMRIFEIKPSEFAMPVPIEQPFPRFGRAHARGTFRVAFVIETDGTTSNIEYLQSPYRALERFVTKAVKQWRFEPATNNGQPVRCRVRIKIPVGLNQ